MTLHDHLPDPRRVERLVQSPGAARSFVRSTLGRWGLHRATESTELLASELVTNAMMHAGQQDVPVELSEPRPRTARIVVSDDSPVLPSERARSTEPGGLGVVLLRKLSRDWGVQSHKDDGKSVWADVDA